MTKTLTQKYRMIADEPESCLIGQMIVKDEDVIGFVSRTSAATGICEVILFEPTEIEMLEGMESISDSEPNNMQIFESVLEKSTAEIQLMWKESVKSANEEPEQPVE